MTLSVHYIFMQIPGGLNMTFFFWIAVSFMMVYRYFSCIMIWAISSMDMNEVKFVNDENQEHSKSVAKAVSRTRCRRVFLQLLDLEIFEILCLSHTVGLKGASSPQKSLKLIIAESEASIEVECRCLLLRQSIALTVCIRTIQRDVIELSGCPPNDIFNGDGESFCINYGIDCDISRYNDPRGG